MAKLPKALAPRQPKRPPFNSETGRAAGLKSAFVKQRMKEWREQNPDAPMTDEERRRQIRAVLRQGTPDALEALHGVIMDPSHKDHVTAARSWIEQDIGKPGQAVEHSGTVGMKNVPATNAEALAEIAALSQELGLNYQLIEVDDGEGGEDV
jgi:hypothetical protein